MYVSGVVMDAVGGRVGPCTSATRPHTSTHRLHHNSTDKHWAPTTEQTSHISRTYNAASTVLRKSAPVKTSTKQAVLVLVLPGRR